MKKLLLFCLLTSIGLIAQKTSENELALKKNELHLNVLMPVVLKSFELEYERCLSDQSGVGASVFIGNSDNFDVSFELTPYFRKYFGDEQAKGFFLEGFTMVNTYKYEYYYYTYDQYGYYMPTNPKIETKTNVAFGIGLGGKFITKDNFIGIINAGIGRNLSSNDNVTDLVARFGIHFGYRF